MIKYLFAIIIGATLMLSGNVSAESYLELGPEKVRKDVQ